MNLALWVAIGAIVGLLVGLVTRGLRWGSALLDSVIGIAGAVPLGWFLLPMSGSVDTGGMHVSGLVGAFVGAAALVAFSEILRP
jgi:uncharacterized membrane protein YeaQ/YmgE (transglycosylase-associated protein family)